MCPADRPVQCKMNDITHTERVSAVIGCGWICLICDHLHDLVCMCARGAGHVCRVIQRWALIWNGHLASLKESQRKWLWFSCARQRRSVICSTSPRCQVRWSDALSPRTVIWCSAHVCLIVCQAFRPAWRCFWKMRASRRLAWESRETSGSYYQIMTLNWRRWWICLIWPMTLWVHFYYWTETVLELMSVFRIYLKFPYTLIPLDIFTFTVE